MKRRSLITAILTTILVSSCGLSSASKEEVVASRPSDELEFAVDTLDSPSESVPASSEDIKVEEQKIADQSVPDEITPIQDRVVASGEEAKAPDLVAPEEPKYSDFQKDSAPNNLVIVKQEEKAPPMLGAEEQYHMQKDETLMMVAFKIYGDYRKWKDLKEWNKGKKFTEGTVLKYYVPDKSFAWRPDGEPYMVKKGDTLQIISMDKYKTTKKWKNIYENNRPLIRDPNLIFAGFTLYYVPIRDIASETR